MTQQALQVRVGNVVVEVPVCWDAELCASVRAKYAPSGIVDLVQMCEQGSDHGTSKENRWFAKAALRRFDEQRGTLKINGGTEHDRLLDIVRGYIARRGQRRTKPNKHERNAAAQDVERRDRSQRARAQAAAAIGAAAAAAAEGERKPYRRPVLRELGQAPASRSLAELAELGRLARDPGAPPALRELAGRRTDADDLVMLKAKQLNDRALELEAEQERARLQGAELERRAAELAEREAKLQRTAELVEKRATSLDEREDALRRSQPK